MNGNMYNSQPSDVTPFAAARHFPQRGQRVGASKAPLKGELAGPKGLTEGFRGRQLRFYKTLGEFVECAS